jgi:hypothetical protein
VELSQGIAPLVIAHRGLRVLVARDHPAAQGVSAGSEQQLLRGVGRELLDPIVHELRENEFARLGLAVDDLGAWVFAIGGVDRADGFIE